MSKSDFSVRSDITVNHMLVYVYSRSDINMS